MASPTKIAAAEWAPERALAALRYHTKLALRHLEQLDLPFHHVQELRLGCLRRRPAASLAARSAADEAPVSRWRASPWGAIYLELEPQCPPWQQLNDAVGPDVDVAAPAEASARAAEAEAEPAEPTAGQGEALASPRVSGVAEVSGLSFGFAPPPRIATEALSENDEEAALPDMPVEAPESRCSEGVRWVTPTAIRGVSARPLLVEAVAEAEAAPAPGAEAAAAATPAFAFCCLSSEEAAICAEVEAHVYAALCHLARAARAGEQAPLRGFAKGGGAPTEGVDEEPAAASGRQPSADAGEVSPMPPTRAQRYIVADDVPDAGGEKCSEGVCLGPELLTCFDSLVEATWVFFIRMRLVAALLRGDAPLAAAWALHLLGVAEPWGMRRLQDLVIHTLEVAAEFPGGTAQAGAGEEGRLPDRVRAFLCEAGAAYLPAPIIPRFGARLRRTVRSLREAGLLRLGAGEACGEEGALRVERQQATLDRVLDELLAPDEAAPAEAAPALERAVTAPALERVGTSASFADGGKDLSALRCEDARYAAFRAALAGIVRRGLDGACAREVRRRILTGADAAAQLASGGPWPEGKRRPLLATLASMPAPAPLKLPPRALDALELAFPDELEAHVAHEDVTLDLHDAALGVAGRSDLWPRLCWSVDGRAPAPS